MLTRYLKSQLTEDLSRKMVFLGGPRQVGKTTLSKSVLDSRGYLNWDIELHREAILTRSLPNTDSWIFDEIHKYRTWRNFLKGLYDQFSGQKKILVTGSARLDFYRFGGDSLQGRYHYLRLHPLTLAELLLNSFSPESMSSLIHDLLLYGGFPEPFQAKNEAFSRRWSREYRSRLIREEIVTLETISDMGLMERLVLRLPELVGSPLSINALREDLGIAHKTVGRWLDILERSYAIFRISPMGSPKVRAVKKEQKHYHYDWTLVQDPGLRFENMVASHLLKWVHFQEDTQGEDLELRYFRDTDKREVDFVLLKRGKPILFVECKLSAKKISDHICYLKKRFPEVEAWQIHLDETESYVNSSGIICAHAGQLLSRFV